MNAFANARDVAESNQELSEMVAMTVGAQAARLGVSESDVSRWLQSAYGAVWVRQTNLNPGLDLRDVRAAIMKGYQRAGGRS